jgi:hypothetical protein
MSVLNMERTDLERKTRTFDLSIFSPKFIVWQSDLELQTFAEINTDLGMKPPDYTGKVIAGVGRFKFEDTPWSSPMMGIN